MASWISGGEEPGPAQPQSGFSESASEPGLCRYLCICSCAQHLRSAALLSTQGSVHNPRAGVWRSLSLPLGQAEPLQQGLITLPTQKKNMSAVLAFHRALPSLYFLSTESEQLACPSPRLWHGEGIFREPRVTPDKGLICSSRGRWAVMINPKRMQLARPDADFALAFGGDMEVSQLQVIRNTTERPSCRLALSAGGGFC